MMKKDTIGKVVAYAAVGVAVGATVVGVVKSIKKKSMRKRHRDLCEDLKGAIEMARDEYFAAVAELEISDASALDISKTYRNMVRTGLAKARAKAAYALYNKTVGVYLDEAAESDEEPTYYAELEEIPELLDVAVVFVGEPNEELSEMGKVLAGEAEVDGCTCSGEGCDCASCE